MLGTRLLDRYEIVSELGRGGMGVVYRARDPLLNRDVAVKLIPPTLLSAESEERFQREAQLVAQMNHPSIVSIFDIGRHEGALFFLMPVVSGRNLRRFLAEKARNVGEVVEIGIRVAEALEYSHTRGVIHRDVKPENIMISDDEGEIRVYVMDFGLAKGSSENRLTKTGTLVGTVAYFSPEQVIARDIDHRSDIYSLGVVLYECLAGETPFTGEVQSLLYRIVHEFPRPIRSIGVNVSEELDEIILCCLAKDPARRYQRAAELAAALRRCHSRLGDSEKSVILSAVMTASMQRPSVTELINREKEFAELQRRLNAAVDGDCQFAVVGGEPGIGKTRLVEELESLARARRIRIVRGRFVEQNRTFAHHAFADLIQDYFRTRDATSSGPIADFSDLADELIDVFPSLSEISGIRTSGVVTERSEAARGRRDDRTYLYELLARTLVRMAGGKPLVIVLENLHAAEASLEALQYVIQRLAASPVLVVATYRQTEIHRGHPLAKMLDAFADDPRFVSMILGPLTASHHREFIASVIGGRELSQTLLQRVFKATEGNPFFTRELVRSLMESGGIVRDDEGTWTLSGEMAISSDALPATIQQAVEKRVERLAEEVRDVLATASILGKSFDFEDLTALVEDEKGLDKAVDRLVADGLLEEERESRSDRLAFTSAIVRDVLYGSLSRRRRRSLHRKYAEYLEGRYTKREAIYPQLVHHFSEGDVPEKTVEYGFRQARRALESFGADEAIQVIRVILDFAADEEWKGATTAEADAHLLMAEAYRQQASLDAALREAEAAYKIFQREKEKGRAVDALAFAAETAWQGRRIEDARRWINEGIALARSAERTDVLTSLLSLGATVANLRGEYHEAKIYLDEAEKLSSRSERRAEPQNFPSGGTLRCPIANLVFVAEPAMINTDEDAEILALIFDNLVTTDEQGRVAPLLVQTWEILEGGNAVHLVLQPNARFSDGSPVTAIDVKRSFERAATAQPGKVPPALERVHGVEAFLSSATDGIEGIHVVGERELIIRLDERLAIYPALLTDPTMAVMKMAGETPVGSGHFRVAARTSERTVLERNPNDWSPNPSRVDRLQFEVVPDAHAIASAFRQGSIDVARDLSQRELDELLRDPRLRPQYVEAPRKNTYFLLFNQNGPLSSDPSLRRALSGVLRVHDLVWRSLGRLAQPAPSLVPPSIFGHDPGRRRDLLTREETSVLIEEARARSGRDALRLTLSMHPTFADRYAQLVLGIAEVWNELGVEVDVRASKTDDYLVSFTENAAFDLLVGRWNSDYDDPDNFTYGLFHSKSGVFRRWFSSPQTDAVLEQARAEPALVRREVLYRTFENTLASTGALVPLFHEVNYRVARQSLRGIRLRSTRPYLNYAELGIAEEKEDKTATLLTLRGAELHVPIIEEVHSIDPAAAYTYNDAEVALNIFETLTRCGDGARIIPWLASEFRSEDGGRRYRFHLRQDVRFHDGRRFTARDVRYSWERQLTSGSSVPHLRCIRGAEAFARGEAKEIQGLRILSSHELLVDLEEPLAILPAFLSQPVAAIVPEGTMSIRGTWRDGSAGTGPFRVVDFQPGRHLELEANPDYWRAGVPKSERLLFHFRNGGDGIREEFVNGKFAVVGNLSPRDIDELLHHREYAQHHRVNPRLGIYYCAFNIHSPLFKDVESRRAMIDAIDVDALVRRSLGRVATPATGVIPPGLLGYTGVRSSSRRPAAAPAQRLGITVRAAVLPLFFSQYAKLAEELRDSVRKIGVEIEPANRAMHDYLECMRDGDIDLAVGRWMVDYPDADNFTHGLLHTKSSFLGRLAGTREIDELTERARRETDVNVRNALYRQIEDAVARDALVLPLFYEQSYRFTRPEIEGLAINFTSPEIAYEQLTVTR